MTRNNDQPTSAPTAWSPLRIPVFRDLLIADLVSDIGAFMQTVGAAWLMTSLTTRVTYIALIQTASALPFFLLALPAGAIGDIFNRRKLILGTEIWMAVIAVLLAVATIAHVMTPWILLLLTLALSLGDAVESPAWRAIFPDLVPKKDLSPALALNGIEFNLARAVGPGLAGLIIAAAGVVRHLFSMRSRSSGLFLSSRVGSILLTRAKHQPKQSAEARSRPFAMFGILRAFRFC